MNVFATVIILMFVLSFALWLGTPEHNSTIFFTIVDGRTDISSQLMILLTVGIITVVGTGLLGFPNEYLIFAGLTVLLVGFVTLPTDLLTSTTLPVEIRYLIGGVYSMMYLLSLLSWYKGVGD